MPVSVAVARYTKSSCTLVQKYQTSNGFAPRASPRRPLYSRKDTVVRAETSKEVAKPAEAKAAPKDEDYIWNENWERKTRRGPPKTGRIEKKEEAGGFLNFNRLDALDSLDVDLSDKRLQKTRSSLENRVGPVYQPPKSSNGKKLKPRKWRYAPTRKERAEMVQNAENMEKWKPIVTPPPEKDPAVLQAQAEQAQKDADAYQELKLRLFAITLLCGGVLAGGAYAWRGDEAAISAGAGVACSLLYLRLLSRGVDQMSGMGSGPAPPSLLVPAILFAGYNRWNALYADYYGVTLQLLPLLAGFFTYKAATLVEAAFTLTRADEEEEEEDDSPPDWI